MILKGKNAMKKEHSNKLPGGFTEIFRSILGIA